MNDDEPSTSASSSAAAAAAPIYDDDFRAQRRPGPSAISSSNLTAAQITARRKQNRQNFNKRRAHLLDDLVRGLDVLVYAELGVGYFMDCSTPLLLLRCLLQFLYLTPKDEIFPHPPSGSRILALIFAANLFCAALHFWRGGPVGGILDRGYLHGGLVLDFIGQKGGVSRWRLVGLDGLVFGLQVVCCAVVRVRGRVEDVGNKGLVVEVVARRQGVEDEERGVRRSEEVGREGDVEMERLNSDGRRTGPGTGTAVEEEEPGRSVLASTTAALERTDAHIFDAFNSGQIVLADLDLGRMVRDEWNRKGEEVVVEETESARRNRATRQRLIERVRGRVGLGRGPAAGTGGEV